VLLALALAERGFDVGAIGLLVGAGLAGSAVATALVAWRGDRLDARTALLVATAFTALGYFAVASLRSPTLLGLAAFLGMVNGFGRDRGAAQTLDLSLLANTVTPSDRTRVFSRYTFVQEVAGAVGALGAASPTVLGVSVPAVFLGVAVLSALPLFFYNGLSSEAHAGAALASSPEVKHDPVVRRRVSSLAALTALDSLGGGFLAGSILAYWFFRRFGLAPESLALLFFTARALNAMSYLVAERLARRFGLIRTMVFTHLPSSALLLMVPVVPVAWLAIALFLARESLVQMDVPTRQSYMAAVVPPSARTFVLGVTGVVRSSGWAVGAPLAGLAMSIGLAAPLYLGAGLKILYDLALFRAFQAVRPPEE
jgi:MFS family permease